MTAILTPRRVFLTAQWRALVMLNYAVPAELVQAFVPAGTELDSHQGQTYVSVVGFLFRETRVLGCRIPQHISFEEVNLRLYVRRVLPDEVRRGVVFVRELVPRKAIALVARLAYNEPYLAVPMQHALRGYDLTGDTAASESPTVSYAWGRDETRCEMMLQARGQASPLQPGSHAEFITEHYWGYCRQRDGGTVEYQVEHPAWKVWQASDAILLGNLAHYYGPQFVPFLCRPPTTAFLADGSAVKVYRPRRIC